MYISRKLWYLQLYSKYILSLYVNIEQSTMDLKCKDSIYVSGELRLRWSNGIFNVYLFFCKEKCSVNNMFDKTTFNLDVYQSTEKLKIKNY